MNFALSKGLKAVPLYKQHKSFGPMKDLLET